MKGEVQLEPAVAESPSDSAPLLENQPDSLSSPLSGSPESSSEIRDEDVENGSAPCCRICLESDSEFGDYRILYLVLKFDWFAPFLWIPSSGVVVCRISAMICHNWYAFPSGRSAFCALEITNSNRGRKIDIKGGEEIDHSGLKVVNERTWGVDTFE